jgi:UDP-N-acetylmuramate dehydrogenase
MIVEHDVPLAPRTTLGLGGPAKRLVRVERIDELREALALAIDDHEPILVLGGGSNLVVRDEGFAGVAIQIGMSDVHIVIADDHAIVSVGAGLAWDELVAQMCAAQLVGVECMSGIPGLVGATPIQNVGAYGQEVGDTIVLVSAFDRETAEMVEIPAADCELAYRSSKFRGSDRWIVLEVVFRLARGRKSIPIRYPELGKALGVPDGGQAPLQAVRDTVIALRRAKGMVVDPDDPDSRSAGSFFTNPIVGATQLAAFEQRLGGAKYPSWPVAGGKTKLAAAWLIERAGFTKGFTRGRVGISSKHALALVNRGGATTRELLEVAREIQISVREKLGIELSPEPIIV